MAGNDVAALGERKAGLKPQGKGATRVGKIQRDRQERL